MTRIRRSVSVEQLSISLNTNASEQQSIETTALEHLSVLAAVLRRVNPVGVAVPFTHSCGRPPTDKPSHTLLAACHHHRVK